MDEDMEDEGMIFSIGEDGVLKEYEEPYTSIECKTEEDYNRLSRLLEMGKNVEKLAMEDAMKVTSKGDISDGDHTFNELYAHRMVLFCIICRTYKEKAWKSWLHEDGTMFDDYFIIGITTPLGDYSYHYQKDNWTWFDVKELPNAPKWDGHKPSDIHRLFSLL